MHAIMSIYMQISRAPYVFPQCSAVAGSAELARSSRRHKIIKTNQFHKENERLNQRQSNI